MGRKKALGWLIPVLIGLVACNQQSDLPTRAPTAVFPTEVTITTPLPTAASQDEEPTPIPSPSASPVLPTVEPTPVTGLGVNITTPSEGGPLLLGQEANIGGLVQLRSSDRLEVALVSASNHLISEAEVKLLEFNSWSATLAIPHSTSGFAQIQAYLYDESGNLLAADAQPVQLVVDRDATDRYLELYRPVTGESAVAGYNLFFDGRSQLPVNNLVTISILNESCQTEIARQGFRLRGSGYWQGFVVIPNNVSGPACAIVFFGAPGDDTRREAHVTFNILPIDDPDARAVKIGNPPSNSLLTPGKTLPIYGTAYLAPDDTVLVSVLLENGRILTEGVATVNNYGYWEMELFIPNDVIGLAQIEASIGQNGDDSFAQEKITVNIGSVE